MVGNNRQLLTVLHVMYFMGKGEGAKGNCWLFYLLFILWEGAGNNRQLLSVLFVIYFMGGGNSRQFLTVLLVIYFTGWGREYPEKLLSKIALVRADFQNASIYALGRWFFLKYRQKFP